MKDGLLKNFIITIVFLSILVLSFSLTKKDSDKEEEKRLSNPLKKVNILNTPINIEDNKYNYDIKLNCSNYELNNQIINYELKEPNNKVSVSSKFYNNNTELEFPDKYMTNFNIQLHITTSEKEIIYTFNTTCDEV